jgi:hypothetical protein
MSESPRYAPGWPGVPPRWTSSAKTGLGTALRPSSRVWFTLHVVDLPTDTLPIGSRVVFTCFWPDANRWEQQDYFVVVDSPE